MGGRSLGIMSKEFARLRSVDFIVLLSSLREDLLRCFLNAPGLAEQVLKAGLLDRDPKKSLWESEGEQGTLPMPSI